MINPANNHVLIVAFHFPPLSVSSGVQRALAWCEDLPSLGWSPLVLTVSENAYAATDNSDELSRLDDVVVERSFARHIRQLFALTGGRYPGFLALPDPYLSWYIPGVVKGLQMIRQYKPKVIVSTYPIATAHLIAMTLKRLTGLPWVADFRDTMFDDSYPKAAAERKTAAWVEKRVFNHCDRVLVTAPGAKRLYQQRYPDFEPSHIELIPNGYRESVFKEIENLLPDVIDKAGPTILLHSGTLYPVERDPSVFFKAIAELKSEGKIDRLSLQVHFRASGFDEYYQPMINQLDIDDIVCFLPGLSYKEAIKEMLCVDGLMVFQAENCNHQIPAKIYEYIRAGVKILPFVDFDGDTASVLVALGYSNLASISSTSDCKTMIMTAMDGKVPVHGETRLHFDRRLTSESLGHVMSLLT